MHGQRVLPWLTTTAWRGVCLATVAFSALTIAVVDPVFAQDGDNDGLADTTDPCPAQPRNQCAGAVAVDSVTGLPIRLNANVSSAECSGVKIDCAGQTWAADFGYNKSASSGLCNLGGGGESCVITGISTLFGCESEETADIFQCEHWDSSTAPELSYSFNVPDGRYIVNLFFANTYTKTASVGARIFDILVEGALAYDDFDQVAAAGGSGAAVVRAVDVTVSDGNGLQIEFLHVKDNPAIKAIEVLQVGCVIDPQTGGCAAQPIEFGQSTLAGATGLDNPTSLAHGPDGRLYVSQQNGLLRAYTITRSGPNQYSVSAEETISLVQSIPNHNDDGTLASSQTTRQVTGILATGTAASPVLYVGSSDPRIGGGSNSTDKNVDTNSGIVSRLTKTNGTWQKLDLVRGLPRSAENHASNGLALDPVANVLYVAQGGHTNMGAPSNNFVFIPEYALSAAILSIDLDAIGNTTYDLPTLDDETRPGTNDAGDPFGGNDGKNQAQLIPGGPVQVYSPGYRNPYDLVLTRAGRMYITDNGPNINWGDLPSGEGTSSCTNAASEPGVTRKDRLHHVSGPGYYGGHANPTRGWSANTFNTSNPQSPVSVSNPVECDYRYPGLGDGSIAIFDKSTNGLTEYTTSHFGGQLQGNLLAASFDKQIWRIALTPDGTQVANLAPLFSAVGATPLDVIAAGDEDPFPGTIWVADHAGDTIFVFEPTSQPECSSAAACTDANPCTNDSCVGGVCQHTFNTSGCDDGVACTTGDVCAAGACAGTDACTLGQTCNLVNGQCEGVIDPLVDMTIEDFHLSGTQVGDVSPDVIETSDGCTGCHGPYDVDNDMYSTWRGSLMGLAGRDPLFYAQMTTANQDVANVGYFCMRCHVPMSFLTGNALDADGSSLDDTDRDGVTCHFCHSMVDPIYKPGISPIEDLTVLAAHDEIPSFYGNSMFVLDPSGLRRGPYDDANAQHDWVASAFHRSSDMCGTCHDVGNVAVTKQPDGSYRYNDIGQASPTEDLHQMFPLERTYTEWKLSAFASGGVDMGGRFGGGGVTVVETCQDCHMPKVSAPGCIFTDARPDLPRHEFAGASAQVLDLIAEHYADDPAVDLPSIARSRAAAVSMLERAASLELGQTGTSLDVRVINETGHKLPTGHIEGRRVWINVRFLDAAGTTIAEHGHYDSAQAELDEASTVVFEMHVGLSADAAAATGYPAGPTGHMALADTIEKDNRIPPRGFDNTAYEAAGAPAVGEVYADGQYWHDSRFEIPSGAVRAEVALYYQNTPRHYIEELRDNNRSDHWGDTLFDLWERTGKGAPIAMRTASLGLDSQCSTNSQCDDGNACTLDVCNGGACTNDPAVDGTTCNDGLACTTGDICIDGTCEGTDDCPLNQVCDAGTGTCATVSGDPDNDGLADSADPCPGDPRNLCFGPVAVDGTTQNPLRINANSSNSSTVECAGVKTDCTGAVWSADTGFNTGSNAVCNLNGGGEGCVISGIDAIFGCEDESTEDLFQCERYDPTAAPELQYSFNVANGQYLVNLYFANGYTGTATGGSRVFDIQVEGVTVYPDFDQVDAAGGSGIAVVRSAIADVSDGNGLQIQFLHAVENPAIKAIEVLTATPACTVDAECNDGNVCNGTETCNPTVGCLAGTPLACNDGNACNGVETCNAASGCVAGTPLVCNDGDACNGLESCLPASGCQSGTPLDCSDGDPCTTDSCSAGVCTHSGSCPPTGNVAVDAASVRTACVGTAGDSITISGVPVGSQADRILVVTVGAEENNGDCNLGLASASATYGGLVMSKAVNRVSNTSSWRACNGIFYLLNPPTGTADVVINFPTTAGTGTAAPIDNRHAGALVIYNAAQQAPETTATAGANANTNPVNTATGQHRDLAAHGRGRHRRRHHAWEHRLVHDHAERSGRAVGSVVHELIERDVDQARHVAGPDAARMVA